jgi:hypothetical protein
MKVKKRSARRGNSGLTREGERSSPSLNEIDVTPGEPEELVQEALLALNQAQIALSELLRCVQPGASAANVEISRRTKIIAFQRSRK